MLLASELQNEISDFFDAFVTAFSQFDGNIIAQRYIAPYVALNGNGELKAYAEHRQIGSYFQEVVSHYHQQGCRSCRFHTLEMAALGQESVLATVTWELLLENGAVFSTWRESYSLMRTSGGWRVFASIDHVE